MRGRTDGGPAFPRVQDYDADRNSDPGMSLRDWFAGQAINSLVPNVKFGFLAGFQDWTINDAATHAYAIADAMLKARE